MTFWALWFLAFWTTLRGKSARSVPHVEIAVLLFHPVGLLVTAADDELAHRPRGRERGQAGEDVRAAGPIRPASRLAFPRADAGRGHSGRVLESGT
jgi:hypothetical protein